MLTNFLIWYLFLVQIKLLACSEKTKRNKLQELHRSISPRTEFIFPYNFSLLISPKTLLKNCISTYFHIPPKIHENNCVILLGAKIQSFISELMHGFL